MGIASPSASPADERVLQYCRFGRFSGSAVSLRDAFQAYVRLNDVDLMDARRHWSLLGSRVAGLAEAARDPCGGSFVKTRRWSEALERHYLRKQPNLIEVPHLFVQTLSAFAGLPNNLRYAVYTDRVGIEGSKSESAYRSRYTNGWLRREREFLRKARKIFLMGSSTSQVLIDEYGIRADRIEVVGAGPNAATGGRRLRTAARTLLFVGMEWDRKGGPLLLEAFRAAKQDFPWLELVIVGANPSISTPGVSVLGRIQSDRMSVIFERSDILIIPTYHEPYGIALIEGLLSGIPCIGTTVGNQRAIIGDAGICVPPGEGERLLQGINDLIADYDHYARRAMERGKILQREQSWNRVARCVAEALFPGEFLAAG